MVTFRNNRRGRFRGGDRNFKRNNGEANKYKSDFPSNTNFQRKAPGRNNHNASKLIEKYNDKYEDSNDAAYIETTDLSNLFTQLSEYIEDHQ